MTQNLPALNLYAKPWVNLAIDVNVKDFLGYIS